MSQLSFMDVVDDVKAFLMSADDSDDEGDTDNEGEDTE